MEWPPQAGQRPAPTLAAEKHVLFNDYHVAMADADGGFRGGLANDLLHPNRDGYKIMRSIMLSALAK